MTTPHHPPRDPAIRRSTTDRRPVVVALDGQPSSLAAVPWAAAEADRRRAPLVVLHALDPATGRGVPDLALNRAVIAAHELTGEPVQQLVVPGTARQVLTDWTRQAQVMVLGPRDPASSTDAVHTALGLVVAHAPCPIVVVNESAHGRNTEFGVLAIGDAEPSSATIFDWALDLAERWLMPLTVAHAATDLRPREHGGDQDADTLAWLDDDALGLTHTWDASLTEALLTTARRQHPTVEVTPLMDEDVARALLADPAGGAEIIVTDAHHARRLLHLIARRHANAYLTIVIPSPPPAMPPLTQVLEQLDAATVDVAAAMDHGHEHALCDATKAPVLAQDGLVPRVLEPALIPARPLPAVRQQRRRLTAQDEQ